MRRWNKRDGRGLRSKFAAMIAAVAMLGSGLGAGVALAVEPKVDAGSDAAAAEQPQTTKAAETADANGGDNTWQIVKCGAENKDSEECTQVSEDGNVRVHKWVTSTETENVFDVHLSIDK